MIQNTNYGVSKTYVDGALSNTYTKTETDTLLSAKADDNAVVHLAGAETIPGAKTFTGIVTINNVVSQNATSYGFKTVKSPLAIAEYTANNSVLQETWQDKNGINLFRTLRTGNRVIVSANDTSGTAKTSVTLRGDIEALEIPTATGSSPNDTAVNIAYLDGYTPMVRTTGNQTIAGVKTFATMVQIEAPKSTQKLYMKVTNIDVTDGTSNFMNGLQFVDKNGVFLTSLDMRTYSDTRATPYINARKANGSIKTSYFPDGRAYDTTDTDVLVDIGTLKASTDVVHTSGAEIIGGVKTFTNQMIRWGAYPEIDFRESNYQKGNLPTYETGLNCKFQDKDAVEMGNISLGLNTNGSGFALAKVWDYTKTYSNRLVVRSFPDGTRYAELDYNRPYSAGNTNDVATIGTLDAYTPMVRTSGNQTISGLKKFTGANVKIQGGITFNDSDDTVRGSVFNTTPTLYMRSYSQLKDNEFSELRLSCNRTETQITFGLYLLSYQNVNGEATLKDYHPIYEKVVTL